MNPLDHTTPEALFGADALADSRALRKAYARLIRRFDPETSPEVFAHIRRLYEAARRRDVQGPAPEVVVPAAAPEAPPVDDWREALHAGGLEAGLTALEARVRGQKDPEAARLLTAVLAGRGVAQVRAGLVRIWPELTPGHRKSLLLAAFELRPGLAGPAQWDPTFDDTLAPSALALLRLEALSEAGLARAAGEVFTDSWDDLRTGPLSTRRAALALVGRSEALYWLPATLVHALRVHVGSVAAELDDATAEYLLRRLIQVQSLHGARLDRQVPDALVEVLWAAREASPQHAALFLQDVRAAYASAGVSELADHLMRHHPAVLRMVDELVERASGRSAWAWHWSQQSRPPPTFEGSRGPIAPRLAKADADLELVAIPKPPPFTWEGVRRAGLQVVAFSVLGGLISTLGGLWMEGLLYGEKSVTLMVLWGVVGVPVLSMVVMASIMRGQRERTPDFDPLARWRPRLVVEAASDMARNGLWTHDLATRLNGGRSVVVAAFLDELLCDRTADLRAVTDAHCGRAALSEHR